MLTDASCVAFMYTDAGIKDGLASLKANDKAGVTLLQQVAAAGLIDLHLATIQKEETGGADGGGDDYFLMAFGSADIIDAESTWYADEWKKLDGGKVKLGKQQIEPEAILQVGISSTQCNDAQCPCPVSHYLCHIGHSQRHCHTNPSLDLQSNFHTICKAVSTAHETCWLAGDIHTCAHQLWTRTVHWEQALSYLALKGAPWAP